MLSQPVALLPFADYVAIDAVNWSTLKALRVSPRHYRAVLDAPREDKDAYRLGRAVHCAVFEPLEFGARYREWTGGRRAGRAWDEFADECAAMDVTPLTTDQWQRALAIAQSVRACPLVAPMLVDGLAEHVVTWTDERTGVACKARLDWLAPGLALDLKTARNATDPRAFAASAWRYGYYHQMAWYARGAGVECARLVAVEPEAPHDVMVYEVSEDALWCAGRELDRLLDVLVECRRRGEWPGAAREVYVLEVPRWVVPDGEDMEVGPEPDWIAGAGV